MDADNYSEKDEMKSYKTQNNIKAKGKLKIFLGYAPGVGKSYAMLQSAQELKENGTDVVVGYINENIGKEACELLKGFERIRCQQINDNKKRYEEFNLNEALNRRPEVIIVDELAHTNPALCRHNKRWQDIEELIIAGIDVYTTINVQNLESLNDVIYNTIGIKEDETIPDSILSRAEKIELIDMPTSELLSRFKESNRYDNDLIKSEVYYDEEKLKALRELALRKTADIVNSIVQISKLSKDKTSVVPIKERIAVCISTSPSSAKVIRAAARMAISLKSDWIAIYVSDRRNQNLNYEERKQLRKNMRLAERLGAMVEMLHGEDKVETIIKFCNYRNITKIIIGRNVVDKKYIFNINKKDIVDKLIEKIKNIEVNIIPTSDLRRRKSTIKVKEFFNNIGYFSKKNMVICILITIIATIISLFISKLKIDETTILLIYLLAVICTSLNTKGYIAGIVAAFINVLTFNFVFTEPQYTFYYNNPNYIVTLPLFVLVAVITSALITRVKEQAEVFSKSEEATQMLYEISRSFINISGEEEIINKGIAHMSQGLKKSIVYFKVTDGKLGDEYIIKKKTFKEKSITSCTEHEFEIVQWVLKNRREAGKGTDTHNKFNRYYTPIISDKNIFGIIGICCNEELDKDELTLIDAITAQMALALDRENLVKEKEDTRLQFEREKLRSNLLRAISHDLRTPLTCIAGSSGLILESYEKLSEEMKFDLIKDIKNDSEWLIRLVENLLSMTRIESNKLSINKKVEMAEEIISESIQHIKGRLENHKLKIDIPDEMLFISMDGKLIEQVIINLVDNAIKYTKPGSEIFIKVYAKEGLAYFQVSDNGPGIDANDLEHIFDTFYKGTTGEIDSRRGVGLGLSICNSIVAAHGGSISVKNNESGGATFTFTLPM